MTWVERTSPIQVGTKVAYSRDFCRNTGQMTGDTPMARGVVKSIKPWGQVAIAEIDWQGADLPGKVLVSNLSPVRDGQVIERD